MFQTITIWDENNEFALRTGRILHFLSNVTCNRLFLGDREKLCSRRPRGLALSYFPRRFSADNEPGDGLPKFLSFNVSWLAPENDFFEVFSPVCIVSDCPSWIF